MAEFVLDPCVEDELWDIWNFIAQDNPDAAARVLEAVFDSFKLLAENPGLGRIRRFTNPRLRNIRSWPAAGFENYVIFYRAARSGVQVLHVYHGARDIEALFSQK